jgi:hypothetical protein
LDFPEAIFTSQGLLYLSHVNPRIPSVFSDLPRVPWRETKDGVVFERTLPNGVAFGGRVKKETDSAVALEIHIHKHHPGSVQHQGPIGVSGDHPDRVAP